METFNAVEVAVKNLGISAVFVEQGEGGAGHFVFLGGMQTGDDALGQCGFAAAQLPAKQHQQRSFQSPSQGASPGNRLFGRLRNYLFSHAPATPAVVSCAPRAPSSR